jgi:hypothetical protein
LIDLFQDNPYYCAVRGYFQVLLKATSYKVGLHSMTACMNCMMHYSVDDGIGFGTGTKPASMISKSWRRLQIRRKKRGLLITGSLETITPSYDQYVMLEDDGYEEGASSNKSTNEFHVDESQDILFIPQWSTTMMEPQFETTKDLSSIDCSDDGLDEIAANAGTVMHNSEFDDLIGAFPKPTEVVSDAMTMFENPSTSMDDIEEVCGITFLRPGDNNKRKKYRTGVKKSIAPKHVSDSETEEDSSSMSSITEEVAPNNSDDGKNNKQRRSIRFSDEVLGQSLTTIHLVPWSEHEDPEWIPRPVRCRIEL